MKIKEIVSDIAGFKSCYNICFEGHRDEKLFFNELQMIKKGKGFPCWYSLLEAEDQEKIKNLGGF